MDFRLTRSDYRFCRLPRRFDRPAPVGSRSLRRRGFSFAEVMFAVIVLGIGFIMVAAIFPVAIQQTRLTVDESTAAAVARQATSALEQVANASERAVVDSNDPTGLSRFPLFQKTGGTGNVTVYSIRGTGFGQPGASLHDALWERLRGNLVLASDPRFAWTIVYSRENSSQFIRAYIFVLQLRNRTVFESSDLQGSAFANIQPRLVRVRVEGANPNTGAPASIRLVSGAQFVGEGAFLVIAANAGSNNGQVYRLGVLRDNDTYEPDPGYGVEDGTPAYTADAWVVGRGLINPANSGSGFEGPVMDVALYTTFFNVN